MCKCMAGCLLLWPPPSPTKGRNLFITQWTLRISHPTTNWTTTQKGKPWSFRPQLTIFNMEMETHKKTLRTNDKENFTLPKVYTYRSCGSRFFLVSLVPQTRHEMTWEMTYRTFDTQQHSKRCCVRRSNHKVSVQTNGKTFHMLP